MGLTDKHLAWGDDIPSEDEKTYYRQIDNLEKENARLLKDYKAYELGKLDALNEIKEEIKNCIVHSPYFHTTSDCCHVRDDVMQIFDKHITKIEEDE